MTQTTAAGLASALGMTTRRIRQLRDEGIFRELPGGFFDVEECRRAHRIFIDRRVADIVGLHDEIRRLTDAVEDGLAALARVPVAERFASAEAGVGPLIGTLDHRLNLIAALAGSPAGRAHGRNMASLATANSFDRLTALLGVVVSDDPAKVEGRCRG